MAQRVVSKNLFNFRPQGFVDKDILAFDEKMRVDFNIDMAAMKEKSSRQTVSEYCSEFRQMANVSMAATSFGTHPTVLEAFNSCDHTELAVPTDHDRMYSVRVLVHSPKSLAGQTNRPCIVYAHGGGVIACNAEI